ncbi:MAG TPA: glycosyltransferase family 39 protein [Vicinamibacterales bacterium]|nr:glycosyltransferase family 39 protein [Vicinamibacterales bacterium]
MIIIVLGGFLRLFGIWFGLPYPYARPDEDVATRKAIELLTSGDLNPHFFHWPSLTFYVFGAIYALAGLVKGVASGQASLALHEQILLARVAVAVAGTATLFVLFRIGRRVADEGTGLLAAGLLAVAILHVRESHFAMTDVLMTLFLTISLLLLLRAVDEGDDKASLVWFAASGLIGGLAASTKYSGAAIVAALLPIIVSRTSRSLVSRRAWLPVIAFGGCFAGAFVATSPYIVLDFHAFLDGFRFTFGHLAAGQNVDLGRGWVYHLTHSLPFGAGVPTFAAAIVGSVIMARHHRTHWSVLGSFAAVFFFLIGAGYLVFFRYVLPLLPIVCLAAAVGIRHAASSLVRRTSLSLATSLGILIAIIAGPGLVNSMWFDLLLARTDSRVVAARWLETNLRPGDSFYDAGGKYVAVDLSRTRYRRVTFDTDAGDFANSGGQRPDWLVLHESPLFTYTEVPQPVQEIAETDYVVATRIDGTPLLPRGAIYDVQDLFFVPVWGMWTVERPGPTIRIYRRKDAR